MGETLPTVDFKEQLGLYNYKEALRYEKILIYLCFLIPNDSPAAEH